MALSVTNVNSAYSPVPTAQTSNAQSAAFRDALANASLQQNTLNYLTQASQNAQANNPAAPPLLTVLEDTGQLQNQYLLDFPPQSTQPPPPQNTTTPPGSAQTASTGISSSFNAQSQGQLASTGQVQVGQSQPNRLDAPPAIPSIGTQPNSPSVVYAISTGAQALNLRYQITNNPLQTDAAATLTAQTAAQAVTAAPPAVVQTATPTPTTIPAPPAPATNATNDTASTQTTSGAVASAAVTAQGQQIVAQIPIVAGMNEQQQPVGETITPYPEPVSAAVATAALPSSQVGERPSTAGNTIAGIADSLAHHQPTQTATSTSFQVELSQAASASTGGTPAFQQAAINPSQVVATSNAQSAIASDTYSRLQSPASVSGSPTVSGPPSEGTSLRVSTSGGNPPGVSTLAAANTLPPNLGLINPAGYVALSAAAEIAASVKTQAPGDVASSPVSSNPSAFAAYTPGSTGTPVNTSAASSVTPTTPSLATQLADGVVSHAQSITQNGETEFRLRLTPPELGPVNVQLITVGDQIRGHVIVTSDNVRQMVEGQLPELRQRLEAAGVTVQNFDVSTDTSGRGNHGPHQEATVDSPSSESITTSIRVAQQFRRPSVSNSRQLDVVV